MQRQELKEILEIFCASGWELIASPARRWLDGAGNTAELIVAVKQAQKECGSCGCEMDSLYPRALALLCA